MTFDPRTIGLPVYESLKRLKNKTSNADQQKEQKGQAVELYTYLSTWGMLRLRAEESALKSGKKQVIQAFFSVLEDLSDVDEIVGKKGIDVLAELSPEEYLGLTGLGLAIAREFSFWAEAIYPKAAGGQNNDR